MQAILTRIIPATEKRPTRIKASCARGSLILSYHTLEGESYNKHQIAASLLCEQFAQEDIKRYGTALAGNAWRKCFVSGELPDGSRAHVFIE